MSKKTEEKEVKEVVENVSSEKARFAAVIERYKKTNPVRYERVKDELQRQLAGLK